MNRKVLRQTLTGYSFLSFNILGFLLFTAVPVVVSLVLSMYAYDNITPAKFLGAGNYLKCWAGTARKAAS